MNVAPLLDSLSYGPAPEDAKEAWGWIERHEGVFGHWIAGAATGAKELFEVFDPSTASVLARCSQGDKDDIEQAVTAAREAQPGWEALGGHGRARHLYALARMVQRHARLLAVLETLNNGKPIRESRDVDVPLVARHFYHHAGWAQMRDRGFPGAEPLGVCAGIVPWNFPLLMLAWKVAPALAMGNTVVLKPAEQTPLTALLFAELAAQAGLPPGVLNIVTGDGRTGALLARHDGIAKLAFTGSTEVGKLLRRETAGSGKRLTLELGGKSPFVVTEDADLDAVVEGLVDAIFFNGGQVCCAGSRLLAQESIAEDLYARLRRRMETLRVGSPLDKGIDVGAIVSKPQLDRIGSLVDQGREEGAEVFQVPCPREGWYYPPTLLTGVSPADTVARTEIFGPVLVAMTYRTPSEAVALANDTEYGLAASVWCRDIGMAFEIASGIKAGTVWVNSTNEFDAASGFGGVRESGFGREGGREGIVEYVQVSRSAPHPCPSPPEGRGVPGASTQVDATHKLYIGGKQVRPDSGYAFTVAGVDYASANRKDVRNAVEAARAAQPAWEKLGGHGRAQILYFLAENVAAEFGEGPWVEDLFEAAAMADKFEGRVHEVPGRKLVYARPEALGVVGIVAPDGDPLRGLLRPMAAALSMGCAVVGLASEDDPSAAVRLYRVVESSDVPAGVLNLLTGPRRDTLPTLADHEAVDGIWVFGMDAADVERRSGANLKRVWSHSDAGFALDTALRAATQVKNVWVPFGA
ncbi:aldehyde dehydrogenase family protein [soil metagenome]